MAESTLPYVPSHGAIIKALERIKKASTPTQFTQDFLANKLDMRGGSPKPVIPFLKRTGFLKSDGAPTELYKRFRNDSESGAAAAEALRIGFRPLYEIHESVHEARDDVLRGIIVQHTGAESNSSMTRAILGSFKALRTFADFEADTQDTGPGRSDNGAADDERPQTPGDQLPAGLSLGYTINLHLPATSEVAVFNAIFKSLKEHLIR